MSYEIVKNLKIVKGDNEYILEITSASNNVFPRTYETYQSYIGKGLTKEEIEKRILWGYFDGNLQGGNNKYKKVVDIVGNWKNKKSELINKWYEYQQKRDEVFKNYRGDVYFNKIKEVETLYKGIEEETTNILHKVLTGKIKPKKEQFILKINSNVESYVKKLNKKTYNYTYNKSEAKKFNGIAEIFNQNNIYKNFTAIVI